MPNPGYHQAYVRLRSLTTGAWLVHPELRPRLVADALRQETNLTEVAAQILADRYKVPYTPKSRRTSPRIEENFINMRLPDKLWASIGVAASRAGRKDMDEVRYTLCAHYGLRVPPPPKYKRRARTAA